MTTIDRVWSEVRHRSAAAQQTARRGSQAAQAPLIALRRTEKSALLKPFMAAIGGGLQVRRFKRPDPPEQNSAIHGQGLDLITLNGTQPFTVRVGI